MMPTKRPASRAKTQNALSLLKEDHAKVSSLFDKFAKWDGRTDKKALAHQICDDLTVHAAVEEQIFYPAVRDAINDPELVKEADVEHASLKILIAQIEDTRASDDHFDALVTVLGEYVKHHVKEEEGEMFKQIRKTDIDLSALGESIAQMKERM
jgi:hemerythrin superfamily protein